VLLRMLKMATLLVPASSESLSGVAVLRVYAPGDDEQNAASGGSIHGAITDATHPIAPQWRRSGVRWVVERGEGESRGESPGDGVRVAGAWFRSR